jgi:hypothetical protein
MKTSFAGNQTLTNLLAELIMKQNPSELMNVPTRKKAK